MSVARDAEPGVAGDSMSWFMLENHTGYDSRDLARITARALKATGTRGRNGKLRVVVVASPIRSRGCAEVGKRVCDDGGACRTVNGSKMTIALAAPWRFSMRRLGRLYEHELAHIRGKEHGAMDRDLLLSLGPTPKWARDVTLRYHGRAPDQLHLLKSRNVRNVAAQKNA